MIGGKKGRVNITITPQGFDEGNQCAGECVATYDQPQQKIQGTLSKSTCFDDTDTANKTGLQAIAGNVEQAELKRQIDAPAFGGKPLNTQQMSPEFAAQLYKHLGEERADEYAALQAEAKAASEAAVELERLAAAPDADKTLKLEAQNAMKRAIQLEELANKPPAYLDPLGKDILAEHPQLYPNESGNVAPAYVQTFSGEKTAISEAVPEQPGFWKEMWNEVTSISHDFWYDPLPTRENKLLSESVRDYAQSWESATKDSFFFNVQTQHSIGQSLKGIARGLTALGW